MYKPRVAIGRMNFTCLEYQSQNERKKKNLAIIKQNLKTSRHYQRGNVSGL